MADVSLPTGFRATHDTLGAPWVPWLPGPDAEDILAAPGTGIDAPAAGRITRLSGRDPSQPPPQGVGGPWGLSLYFVTAAGDAFYGTHLSSVAPVGSYAKGQRIGVVGDYPGLAADHVHWSFVGNVRDPRVAATVGAGGGAAPAMSGGQAKSSTDVINQIAAEAKAKGASDIGAILSVVSVEGNFTPGAAPGDQGTSFGPFQLHKGGALPAAHYGDAQAWAWSPAGIDYATDQAVAAERGASGHAAITNIVRGFEHPADPTGEIAKASTAYDSGRYTLIQPAPSGLSQVTGAAGGIAHDIASPFELASKVVGWVFSIRGLQVAGGALLVILGVLWLARSKIPAAISPGGAGFAGEAAAAAA